MVKGQKLVAKVIIEILGAPKEHVEKTIEIVLAKVKEQAYLKVLSDKIFKAKKIKKFWGTFAEIDMEVNGVVNLIGFCFDFMPSSIEILEPNNLSMEIQEIGDLLNDLLARLHKYDMALKSIRAQNIILSRELQKLKSSEKE